MFSSSRTRATEVAGAPGLEIRDRQRDQVPEQPRAQFDIDPVGGVGEHISPQRAKHRLEDRHRDQTDHQHVERREPAMGQHLVGDDLKEQRRYQREQLQEKRRDQYLAQQTAIFVHRLQEPGDVEPARDIGQRGAARHQDDAAGPVVLKLGALDDLRAVFRGDLDQRIVRGHFADDEKALVFQFDDRRQRKLRQAGPSRGHGPRLQLQILRAAQHLRHADRLTGELVAYLIRHLPQSDGIEAAAPGTPGLNLSPLSPYRQPQRHLRSSINALPGAIAQSEEEARH